ncbi:MAG: hypothetical protein FJ299_09605 [Planctomycetes bacterium]|nr:hypothetical protein [Planctomycetota bacterium]
MNRASNVFIPLALTLCSALPCACRTTRERVPKDAAAAAPVRSSVQRAWRVVEGDRVCGFVLAFREDGPGERVFYAVQNEFRQELGLIDAQGRAWRYRPFQEQPDHLTSSTLADGARAILGTAAAARLEELSPAALHGN